MSEAELDEVFDAAWSNEGFVSRDHEEARLEAGRPGAPPVPRGAARARCGHPDLRRARVQLQPRRRPRPRPLGPRRRRADRGRAGRAGRAAARRRRGRRPRGRRLADARDHRPGARDDHGLQVVRRPRSGQGPPARPRVAPAPDLRDGLRGDDRPPARTRWRSTSSSRGSSARVDVDPKRLAKAREKIATAAAGMRARDYTPKPDYLACSYCAVPRHLPGERRPLTAGRRPAIGHPPTRREAIAAIVRHPPGDRADRRSHRGWPLARLIRRGVTTRPRP